MLGRRRRWHGPKTSRGQAHQDSPQLHMDVTQANATLRCTSSRMDTGYQLPYGLNQPTGGPPAPLCALTTLAFPFQADTCRHE